MNTKKLVISVVLLGSFITNPLYARAGFPPLLGEARSWSGWNVVDPLGLAKILAKTKANLESLPENQINEFLLEENLAYFGFSVIQNDSVLAVRPLLTPKTYKPKKIYIVAATAYSSTPEQTDRTPFITASGIHVREGVIAANFLPFGTVIKIPELFGDKTFVVEDRMNTRYWLNIDIWFPKKELAEEFGVKVVKIEIVS